MNIIEYISSGILETYVLSMSSEEETLEVERMRDAYPEIEKEIDEISIALENYASENKVEARETVKPFLMATIDYSERLRRGEAMTFPPILTCCLIFVIFKRKYCG